MKSSSTARPSAVLSLVLIAFGACGDDASTEDPAARAAPPPAGAAAAPDHATATVGDRTWTFSEYSCVILRNPEYVSPQPHPSDDGAVRLSVSHEADGRSAVTVSAEDDSFQYSMGEGGPPPEVSIDGRTVTLEGTFVDAFGSGEEVEGSVTLQC